MKVVVNTSPLISLSILKKLDILPMLFEEIYVPLAVYQKKQMNNTMEINNR